MHETVIVWSAVFEPCLHLRFASRRYATSMILVAHLWSE